MSDTPDTPPKKKLKKRGRKPAQESAERRAKALEQLKKVFLREGKKYFGISGKGASTRMMEAFAIIMEVAAAYLDLHEDGLSYIAKLHHPEDAALLLADLRSRLGNVDYSQDGRRRYFMAVKKVVDMWENLPNDTQDNRSGCIDIAIRENELTLVDDRVYKTLRGRGKHMEVKADDPSALPKGYGTIAQQRQYTLKTIKIQREMIGLTAKAIKESRKGDNTAHALSKLHTTTKSFAIENECDGIGNLLEKIGEGTEKPVNNNNMSVLTPENGEPMNESPLLDDSLSDIDEAWISEPFKEEKVEPDQPESQKVS